MRQIHLHPWRDTFIVTLFLLTGLFFSWQLGKFHWQEILGTLAVLCSFKHWEITRHLAESQHKQFIEKGVAKVTCFRMAAVYAFFRQCSWIIYYLLIHSYAPIAGTLFFMFYPVWSRHINKKDAVLYPKIPFKIYFKDVWKEWTSHINTWQLELLFVACVLIINLVYFSLRWQEWVSLVAILFAFMFGQVANRLSEAEMAYGSAGPTIQKNKQSQKEQVFYLAKEVIWLAYFVSIGGYIALSGTILFILYPFWRKFYRRKIKKHSA